MKILVPLLASATLLAACASTSTPTTRPSQGLLVNYRCTNGEQLAVRFFDQQGTAVLVRGGQNTELNRITSSPPTYQGGQTTVTTNADRSSIDVSIGFMAPFSCQSQGGGSGQVPPPPPPGPPPAPAELRVSYNCTNGEQISVRYFPQQGVASLNRGGQNTELQQQSTPPGFTYTGPHTVLRVQEDRMRLTMTVGNMAAANCTAA
ncbi:MliC family protein [Sandaracinobacter sp. RS1-74]|uniref:MliC family protein n=1 Tax=Sandaracinobacteroides sayramensis TaxID=2913411 RepID=UPI001EDA3DB7|nr:MliC family protein [Sandaracinobacteroides sayramensis]MCG2842843.1 MliC family protein [Sandaracinobacteroides sayramensis]